MASICIQPITHQGVLYRRHVRPPAKLNVPQDKWLSPTQITEKLDQKGYKVTEIEIDDGSYEVEMTDKNGVRVEGHVHPETGELLLGHDDD